MTYCGLCQARQEGQRLEEVWNEVGTKLEAEWGVQGRGERSKVGVQSKRQKTLTLLLNPWQDGKGSKPGGPRQAEVHSRHSKKIVAGTRFCQKWESFMALPLDALGTHWSLKIRDLLGEPRLNRRKCIGSHLAVQQPGPLSAGAMKQGLNLMVPDAWGC